MSTTGWRLRSLGKGHARQVEGGGQGKARGENQIGYYTNKDQGVTYDSKGRFHKNIKLGNFLLELSGWTLMGR